MQTAMRSPAPHAYALAAAALAAIAFSVLPFGGGAAAYTFVPLYSFCSADNCTDGNRPASGVILDGRGDLFGTTESGGKHGDYGTVYELTP